MPNKQPEDSPNKTTRKGACLSANAQSGDPPLVSIENDGERVVPHSPMHLPLSTFWIDSAGKVFAFQPFLCQTEPSRYSI
jgi:hypothetical protein